jgi:hypothetical protein
VDSNIVVLLHGGFGTTILKFFEGTLGLFSPDELGGEEGDLCVVVVEPEVARSREIPVLSGFLGGVKNFLKSCLHLSFNIAEVALDSTGADE